MRRGQAGQHKKMVYREPNGRRQREKAEVVTLEAMGQRVRGLGIKGPVSPVAAAMLCRSQDAGTALGRLMWVHLPDGGRKRRMMADGKTPVITDAMKAGADTIRAAWVAWSRASGLPCRNPPAIGLGVSGGSGDRPTSEQEQRAADRWRAIEAALKGCEASGLVWACVESVVIENCEGLILQRAGALAALRRGLAAVGR